MGVEVDYDAGMAVEDATDVESVFAEFLTFARENELDVLNEPAANWRFDSASPHGTYKCKRYWEVLASVYNDDDDQWRPKCVFDVSEEGEVVRLLGCI